MSLNRRLRKDENAVSEVVGTILVLSITVVLFSTIFATVSIMDTPERTSYLTIATDMSETLGQVELSIEHKGGNPVRTDGLSFHLIIFEGSTAQHRRYDLQDISLIGDDTSYWDIGDVVRINVTDLPENWGYGPGVQGWNEVAESLETLTIMISSDNRRIWEGDMVINEFISRLYFRDAGVVYPFSWENFIRKGGDVSFYTRLSAPGDIKEVNVFLDLNDIDTDLNRGDSAWGTGVWNMTFSHTDRFTFPGESVRKVRINSDQGGYWLPVYAHTGNETHTESLMDYIRDGGDKPWENSDVLWTRSFLPLAVGEETVSLYQPDLMIGNVRFSPRDPSHGDTITVTADIYNNGFDNYTATWELTDDGNIVAGGARTFARGPAPTRITAGFTARGHGPHEIELKIGTDLYLDRDMLTDPIRDVYPDDNEHTFTIHVDLYVLVIRDSISQDLWEGRIMGNDLLGLNLDNSRMEVNSPGDIPTKGDLSRASLIIWMTGDEGEYLSNPNARDVIDEFIDDGGAFWLIGTEIPSIGALGDLGDKLGYTQVHGNVFIDEETLFEPGGERGTYGRFNYTVGSGEDYRPMEIKAEIQDNNTLIDNDNIFGVGLDLGPRNRTAVNSFLFGNIQDPGQRSNMVAEVISWLTGMTQRSGVDVAVASQLIEPANPMFMDDIVITATLRNNGPEDLQVTVRCERNSGVEVLRPEGDDPIFLERDGGVGTVTFVWTAVELGTQEFIVIADYYNEIDMVTRINNDIRYKDLEVTDDRIEVNVHYSTLLVDADYSDHFGYHDVTKEIEDSFVRLGYEEGINYDYFLVEENSDGPSFELMSEYNAVFWVTGERGDIIGEDVFTSNDLDNLMAYVNQPRGANLMLVGENILEFLETEGETGFLANILGMDPNSIEEIGYAPRLLLGQKDNPLPHGLEYNIVPMDNIHTFEPQDAEVLFRDEEGTNLASIRDDGNSKVIYMGVNLNRFSGPMVDGRDYGEWVGPVDLSGERVIDEFVYTTLWQLGNIDERAELRVIHHDVYFSSEQPHTGRSYLIRAEIQNIGYRGATALIRINDGEDYVGSESIFIEGSHRHSTPGSTYFEIEPGTATVEVNWRPTSAGYRDVRISVDPIRRTNEISSDGQESTVGKLMEFHNQASVRHPVYYFYDDMELGEGKWSHDATVVNINGGSALDFVDRADVDTNVIGDWDYEYSGMTGSSEEDDGFYETDDDRISRFTKGSSFSQPHSYWMPETPAGIGEFRNVDMAVVVDTSGSMRASGRDWWWHAYQATIEVARVLGEGDRMAIFAFDSTNPTRIIGFDEFDAMGYCLCDEHEQQFIDEVITPNLGAAALYNSWTPLFDTTSRAIEELDGAREDATKAGILLTDGAGNYDNNVELYEPGGPDVWPGGQTGRARFEQGSPGLATFYERGVPSGQLKTPYSFMTVTIGGLTRESRLHKISASAQGHNSFGVFEDDASKLAPLFRMYAGSLIEESVGGIRSATPGEELYHRNEESIITDFTVFSDGFLGGLEWFDVSLEEGETIYDFGNWRYDGTTAGFFIREQDPYNYGIYAPYRWAESENVGSTIDHLIDPLYTFNRLPGEIREIVDVKVNLELFTGARRLAIDVDQHLDGNWVQAASNIGSNTNELDGGDWVEVSIMDFLDDPTRPFDLRFRHQSGSGYLYFDHVNVVYTLDYAMPAPSSTFSQPSSENINQDIIDLPDGYFMLESPPYYRYISTPPVDITNTASQRLSFRTRYWMTEGTNGGIMYLWGANDGNWEWEQGNRRYIRPDQSYPGNLDFDVVRDQANQGGPAITGNFNGLRDATGELPQWCFNGRSGGGTFGWEYMSVDLSRYAEFMEDFQEIRIVFVTAQMGGISVESGWKPDMGWYIDNVNIKVTRDSSGGVPEDEHGYWIRVRRDELSGMGFTDINEDLYYDHSGDADGYFWMFARNVDGEPTLPLGVDTSLYTSTIYLTNAIKPVLSAYLRFNIDSGGGFPPDGIRVEISNDDGRSWDHVTRGVRVSWGVSGDDQHGEYSGETHEGIGDHWVEASTLTRFNIDLSRWRGDSIRIRFRVFTNRTETYADTTLPKAIFIDQVVVREAGMDMMNYDDDLNLNCDLDTPGEVVGEEKTLALSLPGLTFDDIMYQPWLHPLSEGGIFSQDRQLLIRLHQNRFGVTDMKSFYPSGMILQRWAL